MPPIGVSAPWLSTAVFPGPRSIGAFRRAVATAARGRLMEHEVRAWLLARTLIDNSIWTVTRAVNCRVTKFVQCAVSLRFNW